MQEKYLGMEPDAAQQCADLCAKTIGGSCKAWTFCWSSGRCATMARAPESVTQRADGRSAYNPKCASGVKRAWAFIWLFGGRQGRVFCCMFSHTRRPSV
jgi:hypothetical protein